MITNEVQYRSTKARRAQFEQAVANLEGELAPPDRQIWTQRFASTKSCVRGRSPLLRL